jgi:hypothetical protein
VGAHQLLSGEEERELAGSVQRLLQLEAAAEREAACLGRELQMSEWAAAAGYNDVGAFGECIKVRGAPGPVPAACGSALVLQNVRQFCERTRALATCKACVARLGMHRRARGCSWRGPGRPSE